MTTLEAAVELVKVIVANIGLHQLKHVGPVLHDRGLPSAEVAAIVAAVRARVHDHQDRLVSTLLARSGVGAGIKQLVGAAPGCPGRQSGEVRFIAEGRAYGWVQPDDEGKGVWIRASRLGDLEVGMRVEYELQPTARRSEALNIVVLRGTWRASSADADPHEVSPAVAAWAHHARGHTRP